MNYKTPFLLTSFLFILAGPVHAGSVELTAGDGAVGAQTRVPLLPGLSTRVGFLRTGKRRGEAKIYTAGLEFAPPTPLLHWSVGIRYQYQSTGYGSGGGLALGGSLSVPTPIPLLSVGAGLYYIPSMLSNGRVRRSHDAELQLRLNFPREIYAYVGYRDMRTSFSRGNHALYKGPALGFGVGF